jgi:hypothetical protein
MQLRLRNARGRGSGYFLRARGPTASDVRDVALIIPSSPQPSWPHLPASPSSRALRLAQRSHGRADGDAAVPGLPCRHDVRHRHDAVEACARAAPPGHACSTRLTQHARQSAQSSAGCATYQRCVCALATLRTHSADAAGTTGPALRVPQRRARRAQRRVCARRGRRGAGAPLGRGSGDVCTRLRHVWCAQRRTARCRACRVGVRTQAPHAAWCRSGGGRGRGRDGARRPLRRRPRAVPAGRRGGAVAAAVRARDVAHAGARGRARGHARRAWRCRGDGCAGRAAGPAGALFRRRRARAALLARRGTPADGHDGGGGDARTPRVWRAARANTWRVHCARR